MVILPQFPIVLSMILLNKWNIFIYYYVAIHLVTMMTFFGLLYSVFECWLLHVEVKGSRCFRWAFKRWRRCLDHRDIRLGLFVSTTGPPVDLPGKRIIGELGLVYFCLIMVHDDLARRLCSASLQLLVEILVK